MPTATRTTSPKPMPPVNATFPTTCRSSAGTSPLHAASRAGSPRSWRTCANWTGKPERTDPYRVQASRGTKGKSFNPACAAAFFQAVACAPRACQPCGTVCPPACRCPPIVMHHDRLGSVTRSRTKMLKGLLNKKMAAACALMAGVAFAPAAMAALYFGACAGAMRVDGAFYNDPFYAGVLIVKVLGVVSGYVCFQEV